ncbi:LOW QUALITY PROTEIN: UBX domain-containing protein 7 [Pogonomyrmex barbatus]|uniref:LOW QUALITY PROTEIN: UBX domain-containing protein 7 n=1 Tax=Pogonomyrmex barbatus TaxID=144034 RepID=A0A6I9WZE7_9HYME|nr:LOW QUALITY PROTEIN: UBX domain-containing protein 7 [Pogonomyrmex barbatus]
MDRELVEKFIEVTGENEATAQQYLALTDGNVEMAISLMFEGSRPPETENANPEPPVRAPILPTREILVPSEPVCSLPQLSNNVFDRFRDFAVETQRQEEEMTRRVTGTKNMSQKKTKRLEDLFRPPCNILFLGSFMEARDHAKTLNRWLLVNVQNPQEFSCQVLNRDVWPNEHIQEIIKDHFILWQVLSNSSDGRRYIDFYNVVVYPYLAIVDPRTGECMKTYNNITVDSLISDLNDVLSTHPSPESTHPSPTQVTSNTKDWNNFPTTPPKRNSLADQLKNECGPSSKTSRLLSEKIVDSGNENVVSDNVTNLNAPSSSNAVFNKKRRLNECAANQQQKDEKLKSDTVKPETNDEPFLRLCLRLPNGAKETISMCATDTIEDFLVKMEEMAFPSTEYTFLVPFPKTNVGALSLNTRLLDTILFPTNTVFITKI